MITIEANAKINLSLDILSKRIDGYHEVELILQSIALADTLELAQIDSGIKFELVDGFGLPTDEKNLAYRAAQLMLNTYKIDSGVFIRLTKKIPVEAGLAGGSSDAAAVIKGMNQLFKLKLSINDMLKIAEQIGSDVPFCVIGGTCLAQGRGEILKRLPDLPTLHLVLLKPHYSISTAWAYKTFDEVKTAEHPNTNKLCEAISFSDTDTVCNLMFNVLEQVAIQKYQSIKTYKQKLIDEGCITAMMSGSGPSIFGVAKSKDDAFKIANSFKDSSLQVFVTETVGSN